MSTNPVFAFFATPKSFGPLVLRLFLAAVFALHGGQKAFGWAGGSGWTATVVEWSRADGLGLPVWVSALVIAAELAAAAGLLLGFLTRLCGLSVVAVMTGALLLVHAGQGLAECEYPAALLTSALALVFLGGGRLSLDRAISRQLLPTVG